MSTSRRGRHTEKSPPTETADTVVEIEDGTTDVVTPVQDVEDWGPLANIEPGSPRVVDPTTTSVNILLVCV